MTALECVANRPIVDHVLDELAHSGIEQAILVVPEALGSHVRESLRHAEGRFASGLVYLELETVDLVGALRLSAPVVGNQPCVVHFANGLLGEPLTRFATMRPGKPDVTLLLYQGAASADRLSSATLGLLHLAELDDEHSAFGMAGVCVFGESALATASTVDWRADGAIDLTPVARTIAAAGGRLDVHPVEGWRRYCGDPIDLLELNRIALDGLDPALTQAHQNGNRIEGRVKIDATASVRSSVIIGPTIIGAGAQVADAYIGPYTSVGRRARIEGVEIERSIICDGASVLHVGGRLVTSVVGRGARVFRDFSLPRALRLRVGDGTEVALC